MQIVIRSTPADVARIAAEHIITVIGRGQEKTLGLATGSSPQPLYAALAALVAEGRADFTRTRGFALDEYVGLDVMHPQSYHSIIARDVVGPLRLDPRRVFVPSGSGSLDEIDSAAVEYEAAIRAVGGADIQILGIGSNGHIGFNEPGASADSVTRRVRLTQDTIKANSRFFASTAEVPTQAVTQGISTILRAKSIALFANGSHKAAAVRAAIEGPVDPASPASFLQNHPDVTFYLDGAAASMLSAVQSGADEGHSSPGKHDHATVPDPYGMAHPPLG